MKARRRCRVCGNPTDLPDPIVGILPNLPDRLCTACYIDCTCPWCQEEYDGVSPTNDQLDSYVSDEHREPCAVCGGLSVLVLK